MVDIVLFFCRLVMHGVLVKDRRELSEAERASDIAAGTAAMELLKDVIGRKRNKDYSDESFAKTLEVLKLNPELGLAWNARREIILSRAETDAENLMKEEFNILNPVMVEQLMTKSYCLWNHRRWLLLQLRDRDLIDNATVDNELKLTSTILKLDSRNFHAWSFRRWLRQELPMWVERKLEDISYSQSLIENDFSNYSAWFIRRSALEKGGILPDPLAELDLVWNAIFVEPTDQSCWQYHDWLLEKEPGTLIEKDIEYFQQLEQVVEEKDSKYLLLRKLRTSVGSQRHDLVERLCRIDPMRKGYYLDQRGLKV